MRANSERLPYLSELAEVYDQFFDSPAETAAAVGFLATLARDGPILELGVGTGRLAVPLAQQGIEMHGIDQSAAMLQKLQERPGGEKVRVKVGDFTAVGINGRRFSLIFAAAGTFSHILEQQSQLRCLKNVVSRLRRGGVFVVEGPNRLPAHGSEGDADGSSAGPAQQMRIALDSYDPRSQRLNLHFELSRQNGLLRFPFVLKFTAVQDLDRIARKAGLRLRARFGDYRGVQFSPDSPLCVSVYGKDGHLD